MTSSPSSGSTPTAPPRLLSLPPALPANPLGEDAVALCRAAGLKLDPWQAWMLERSLAYGDDAITFAAFEIGLIVPRQNGKGAVIEGRELAGLFLLGEDILHSTHHFRTTRGAYARMKQLIESCPDLDRQVSKILDAHGQEGIVLKNGAQLAYVARSKKSGRGLSPDVVIIDEAFEYQQVAHTALLPAMSARPNPQLWYTSTPPDEDEHTNAVVLSGVRARAVGPDPDGINPKLAAAQAAHVPDPSLMWAEWGVSRKAYEANPHGVSADRAKWAESNPGLGIRLSVGFTEKEHRSLRAPSRAFAVERLGVGYWPDPEPEDAVERPFTVDDWSALTDPGSLARDPAALAVDVAPDRTAAIMVAAWRADGLKHWETVAHALGTGQVIDVLTRLVQQWDPAVVVMDRAGPAAALIPKVEAAGIVPVVTNFVELGAACQGLSDDVHEGAGRHRAGDQPLVDAVSTLCWRVHGRIKAFASTGGGNISPVVGVALANWGLEKFVAEGPRKKAAPPRAIPAPPSTGASLGGMHRVDLATVNF